MADDGPRWTTAELAARVGGTLQGRDDLVITGVQSLQDASDGDLTFVTSTRHARRWSESNALAALVTRSVDVPGFEASRDALILVDDAEMAMIEVLTAFAPPHSQPNIGVHDSAVIDDSVVIGEGCRIGPHVVIGRGSRIGNGVVLHAGVCVYDDVVIGDGSRLHCNVVVRDRCTIGRAVTLHSGVAIGTDGFGYRPAPDGSGLVKVPHIGTVVIEDGVEIGANSCVDRGKFGATIVGAGTKIDNLVQIGHNCRIGRACAIAGMVGLAGSVTIGDGVQIGGQAGVADHLTVGSGARIAGTAAVMKSVPAGGTWAGVPADESMKVLRQLVALRKLPAVIAGLSRLGEDRKPEAGTPPPPR